MVLLGPTNSFYSEIRSSSFLKTVILNNPQLDRKELENSALYHQRKIMGSLKVIAYHGRVVRE